MQSSAAVHALSSSFILNRPRMSFSRSILSITFLVNEKASAATKLSRQKSATAELYIRQLLELTDGKRGSLLEIGCGHGDFLVTAKANGFQVRGIEVSADAAARANARLGEELVQTGNIENTNLPPAQFDVAVMLDVLEHVQNPNHAINHIRYWLQPGGLLLIVTPTTDSWSRRLMKKNWMEYKLEHLLYFNRGSIRHLLSNNGFADVRFAPNAKALTFNYIRAHFRRFRVPFWTEAVNLAGIVIPRNLSRKDI